MLSSWSLPTSDTLSSPLSPRQVAVSHPLVQRTDVPLLPL